MLCVSCVYRFIVSILSRSSFICFNSREVNLSHTPLMKLVLGNASRASIAMSGALMSASFFSIEYFMSLTVSESISPRNFSVMCMFFLLVNLIALFTPKLFCISSICFFIFSGNSALMKHLMIFLKRQLHLYSFCVKYSLGLTSH